MIAHVRGYDCWVMTLAGPRFGALVLDDSSSHWVGGKSRPLQRLGPSHPTSKLSIHFFHLASSTHVTNVTTEHSTTNGRRASPDDNCSYDEPAPTTASTTTRQLPRLPALRPTTFCFLFVDFETRTLPELQQRRLTESGTK